MRRFILAVGALALVVPVVALADHGSSGNSRGAVLANKRHAVKHLGVRREREVRGPITSLTPLTVGSLTCAVPVSGSLPRVRLGDIVELKCRLVAGRFVLRAIALEDAVADDDVVRDDERELTGHITSLSPLTVGTLTCAVPSGVSLAGFNVGQLVEITCDFIGGQWVLRRLHVEDDDDDRSSPGRSDDSSSGPGSGSDDDNSGPGSGDDHSGSDSGSGHGGGRG